MTTQLAVRDVPSHESLPAEAAGLPPEDAAALRLAVRALERSTLTGRLSAMAGKPLEMIGYALPEQARAIVGDAVERALRTALALALKSLPEMSNASDRPQRRSGRRDTTLAAASGAIGGALGLVSLPVELPVSTTLVLRSIAEIAREEGEDLADPETAFACLQVFALGSRTESDDLASSGYFAVRTALARSVTEASRLAGGRTIADSAPSVVRFLAQIASRFGIVVSQKVAATAVPIIGAVGGAAVNAAFMQHFRTVARAHFTVRRLERTYGKAAVRAAYEEIRTNLT
ncbi:EcsC family protein [Enterovirga rhinocerotis]|uniref:EcsC family protein n=1 Tax=Enterovirga rhinocerotis TaxID=1339210 RepID=A0A4R7C914_9HYPH|nr:EcsC family protein [Enterovirga rhinocerotis]TDR94891.1 EcsC family protein [Enterovirga rhinocerotis]